MSRAVIALLLLVPVSAVPVVMRATLSTQRSTHYGTEEFLIDIQQQFVFSENQKNGNSTVLQPHPIANSWMYPDYKSSVDPTMAEIEKESLFEAFRFNLIFNAGVVVTLLLSLNASHVLQPENKLRPKLLVKLRHLKLKQLKRRAGQSGLALSQLSSGANSQNALENNNPLSSYLVRSAGSALDSVSSLPRAQGDVPLLPKTKRKTAFLGAFSSPSHLNMPNGNQVAIQGLRLMSEMRDFQNVFGAQNVVMLPAASWEDLKAALVTTSPSVIHLSGHCHEDRWVFEGQSRAVCYVSGRELGDLFASVKGVKCIVFSGCTSVKIATEARSRLPADVRIVCASTKLNNVFGKDFCNDLYSRIQREMTSEEEKLDISRCFEDTKTKFVFSQPYVFGDPSPHFHEVGPDGHLIMTHDHLHQPHPVGLDGKPTFSQSCLRCNPRQGGIYTLI